MYKRIKPLSGKGKDIAYSFDRDRLFITWNTISFSLSINEYNNIIQSFFEDRTKWYKLGSSMTEPIHGGFGEYILDNIPKFSSRHASAIAAIMVDNGDIIHKGKKPILLKLKQ
jgi:hypothetical protein